MRVKVFVRSVGFHTGRNAQFNLTNYRLATRWIVERWRAMRKNPTLVIGQEKGRREYVCPFDSPRSNSLRSGKREVHVIVEPGLRHCTNVFVNTKKLIRQFHESQCFAYSCDKVKSSCNRCGFIGKFSKWIPRSILVTAVSCKRGIKSRAWRR